ncbi:MAG: non-homologous end-joining DNA ligase [Bdellovibrionales bacterium]|nr:non-homologous end-joining DNA ligase [Bdellovibrionales bacterium]
MSLRVYNRKRKFAETPEPRGKSRKGGKGLLRFVVQMHAATRLHFDLRLEFGGVFKSWAVPKGPSLNPLDQRLAVFVEDHPLAYGSFEGIIPGGNYGAGTVLLWDEGTYIERGSKSRKDSEAAVKKAFEKGHITFILNGHKLKGEFALIKLKKDPKEKAWLLVKKRDEHSTYKRKGIRNDLSVKTGRTIEEIAAEAEGKKEVWSSGRKVKAAPPTIKSTSTPRNEKAALPRKIKPMLATLSNKPLTSKGWLFEHAPNGLRALAEVEKTRRHLYSKSGLSFDKKFPQILAALKAQPTPLLLDGEVTQSKSGNAIYHVYDLLYENGKDLRKTPLKERRERLAQVLKTGKHIQLVPTLKAQDSKTLTVAKKESSLYHSGTSKEWLQLPETKKGETGTTSADEPRLTNLDKIYWPKEQITKGDLIAYYKSIAPYILPHLKDRPQSLNRFPNGIARPGFYQKDVTGHIPRWLKTERIFSESADKSIDYALCQDERSLLYLVNLGCIEMNPWFSRVGHLDHPDFLVIDLDPDDNEFSHVMEVALEIHRVLDEVGAPNACKTSGATGIHIGIPTGGRYDFDEVRAFAEAVCRVVLKKFPATTSMDRSPARRRHKIYLDCMQNRRAQTLAAPFCVRPREGAPVSMPLAWKDLHPRLKPEHFHIGNALQRVQKFGDSWKLVLGTPLNLSKCLKNLRKIYDED